jgi:hypothetical protein
MWILDFIPKSAFQNPKSARKELIMFTRHSFTLTAAAAATILLCVAMGCSSGDRMPQGEKAVESFQTTRTRVAKAQQQVDKTLAALDRMGPGGDLAKAFKQHGEAVKDLEQSGDSARRRAQQMRDNFDAYITKWQAEQAHIKDPTIKATLQQRREAVRDNFEQVRAAADAVRQAYEPFLADQKEIQKALSIDLTPAAVSGLKPKIDQSRNEGATLKTRLAELQTQLDNIEAGLSPRGTASK